MKKIITIALVLIPFFILAEGTRELAPNSSIIIDGTTTNDIAALLIGQTEYNVFAHYSNDDPRSRLYFNIQNPNNECLYFGLSAGSENSAAAPVPMTFEYRIKDPAGNIVYGPFIVDPTMANINSHGEALIGPNQIYGAGGYDAIVVDATALTSAGWSGPGDYYIEFAQVAGDGTQQFLINYWDFSVVDCTQAVLTEKKGRVWSFNWALFAINDFGFPERPFNGSFYVCAPDETDATAAFISKIDFNGSGFQPAAFNIAFNSFGAQNTGTLSFNRMSVDSDNTTQAEYAIYLNDPSDLCSTAEPGEFELLGVQRCLINNICINVLASKPGQIDLLLDFDLGDGIYTAGTADRLLPIMIELTDINQPFCIMWDGFDGLGQDLSLVPNLQLPLVLNYQVGIYHFPVYDAEYMFNGFTVESVRPAGPTPLLYYDDTNILDPSGTFEPIVNLNGCLSPCHRWSNYAGGGGFGNLNTINTWWFSQQINLQAIFELPAVVVCEIKGPDTVCNNDPIILTSDVSFEPAGSTAPIIIDTFWSGPAHTVNPDGTITVANEGTYFFNTHWISETGDTCMSACEKTILAFENCCELIVECGPPILDTFECRTGIPAFPQTIDELITIGLLVVQDIDCGQLEVVMQDIETGSGCTGDPYVRTALYNIWNDENSNGLIDADEMVILCQISYIQIDEVAPIIIPDPSGPLSGMMHNDTMTVECNAADPNWTLPIARMEDVLLLDDCTASQISFIDFSVAKGNCMDDGFVELYQCTWLANDFCGNSAEFTIYMKLVDNQAPVFVESAQDITVDCTEDIPTWSPQLIDNCSCAHLEIETDTIDFVCAADYRLLRQFIATDCCGNTSMMEQFIQIQSAEPLEINLHHPKLSDYSSGDTVLVACKNGTLPAFWNLRGTQDIAYATSCSELFPSFSANQIANGNCLTDGYLALFQLTWTMSDDCGNSTDFNLILKMSDFEAPLVLGFDSSPCQNDFDPASIIAQDNCGISDIKWTIQSIESTCSQAYSLKYLYEITDYCGNIAYHEMTVNPFDQEAPIITAVNSKIENLSSGSTIRTICSPGFIPERFLTRYSVDVKDGCGDFNTLFEVNKIEDSDCNTNQFEQYHYVWTAIDICGNEASFEIYLIVEPDNPKKYIQDLVVNCSEAQNIDILPFVCGIEQFQYIDELDGQACNKLITRTYSWIDICGQSQRLIQTIEVIDNTAPEFDSNPEFLCDVSTLDQIKAWDACENRFVNVRFEMTLSDCGADYSAYKLIAEDACKNQAIQIVHILPLADESIELTLNHPDFGTISNGDILEHNCSLQAVTSDMISVSGTCQTISPNIDVTSTIGNCATDGYIESRQYVISVENACGQKALLTFTIRIVDESAPLAINTPDDITIGCLDAVQFPDVQFYDDCGIAEILKTSTEITTVNGRFITQTWEAIDLCERSTLASRTILVSQDLECTIVADTEINCYSTTELSAVVNGGIPGYTYHWTIRSGDCIQESNGDESFFQLVMLSGPVIIDLVVMDASGCISTCSIILTCEKPTTSIDDDETELFGNDEQISVFPNPVQQQLQIESEVQLGNLIQVYDGRGQLIETIKMEHPKNNTIQTAHWPAGIFLIKIEKQFGSEIKKVIKINE